MADYRLSKVQRNEIFEAARNLGLDQVGFEWKTENGAEGGPIHRLVHSPTGAFIKIDYSTRSYVTGYVFDYWPRPLASSRT